MSFMSVESELTDGAYERIIFCTPQYHLPNRHSHISHSCVSPCLENVIGYYENILVWRNILGSIALVRWYVLDCK